MSHHPARGEDFLGVHKWTGALDEDIPNIKRFEALVGVVAREFRSSRIQERAVALSCLYRAVERFQIEDEDLGKRAAVAMEALSL